MLGALYWPIALVHASAVSTGRRQWTERVHGAIDLVSGRIGLVDVDLPPHDSVEADTDRLVKPRLGKSEALASWHEYFRDYVDRRWKPLRPPALSVDEVAQVWVEYQVVSSQGRLLLADPVTGRADDLKNFPWVEQTLEKPLAVTRSLS